MNGPDSEALDPGAWQSNYFNYFTEIEEHFQRVRGTGLFLISPLDWALVETWKNAGVPLEAVLRGIDAAFEKWRSRKSKTQAVNSLAYCAQTVLTEAQAMAGNAPRRPVKQASAPFTPEELNAYLRENAATVRRQTGYEEIAGALDRLAASSDQEYGDLEQLELRLTALEEKMIAIARATASDDNLFAIRRDLSLQLKPYRSRMSAEQLAMLEKQYLERRLLDDARLPRLSLFYLH